jgi:XTP/dITP diphosphohydrolase
MFEDQEPLERLRSVMDRLRSPGGCPWDSEQTHKSLLKYLIEESYEFIESVENNDREAMVEELGDLLLQVFFHSRIAQERGDNPFSIDDVAERVANKLVSRHPHVFAEAKVKDSAEVKLKWEEIKNNEKSRTDIFDGVPFGQPALSLAAKVLQRAEKNGRALPKSEVEPEISQQDFGRSMLALVQEALAANLDPESELRAAVLRYVNSLDRKL